MSNSTLPQTLKGFRDFLPTEKRQRDFVEQAIKQAFETHGFAPLETPTLEYASLLLGKYGTEADKLVYTFTDRGDREVGLRYDQTVPTARVLGQYQHELPKFFRRYSFQNVFRADKPQKGRYREFRQCDCDIFGSTSPLADAEILSVYYDAFASLGITSLRIEFNDRQTLISTLSPFATPEVSTASIIQSIDKLDKMSGDEVAAELEAKGLSRTAATQAITMIENAVMSDNLAEIVHYAHQLGVPKENLVFNPKIARGLDYYTGLIFEGKIPEYPVGSVGGGGRYDKLIEQLSGATIPAVGFGIGFDRTVEAAVQLGLVSVPDGAAEVMVTVFDDQPVSSEVSAQTARVLREAGIKTELYPGSDQVGKQIKLADHKHIPVVVIIGETERSQDQITLKHLPSGIQKTVDASSLVVTAREFLQS